MNPWHDIHLGFNGTNECNCLIEIPAHSKVKYEIDKESGLLKVDRILHSSVHYPCNYGFFPQTYCDDQDPLDVLVVGQVPVVPLSIMRVKIVGVLRMIDQGQKDDKIISVHIDDPEYNHINELRDLAPHKIAEITHFFKSYKHLENKFVEIQNIDNETVAASLLREAIEFYKSKFNA